MFFPLGGSSFFLYAQQELSERRRRRQRRRWQPADADKDRNAAAALCFAQKLATHPGARKNNGEM